MNNKVSTYYKTSSSIELISLQESGRQYPITSIDILIPRMSCFFLLRVAAISSMDIIRNRKKKKKGNQTFSCSSFLLQQLSCLQHVSPELDLIHPVIYILQGSEEMKLALQKKYVLDQRVVTCSNSLSSKSGLSLDLLARALH